MGADPNSKAGKEPVTSTSSTQNSLSRPGTASAPTSTMTRRPSSSRSLTFSLGSAVPESLLEGITHGATPLHFACVHGHLPILKLLMAFGSNLGALDGRGCTAADVAKLQNQMACHRFLKAFERRPVVLYRKLNHVRIEKQSQNIHLLFDRVVEGKKAVHTFVTSALAADSLQRSSDSSIMAQVKLDLEGVLSATSIPSEPSSIVTLTSRTKRHSLGKLFKKVKLKLGLVHGSEQLGPMASFLSTTPTAITTGTDSSSRPRQPY